jgi:hypothetical protein
MRLNLRALCLATGLLGLTLGLVVWAGKPPASKGNEAAAGEFSAGRALSLLRDLLADETPHPRGSAANERVRQRIIEKLRAIGYKPEVAHSSLPSGRKRTIDVNNLVCRLPGQTEGPAVMLVAHYDSVSAGPGAADDGSGVAIVIEVARILKAEGPFRNLIVFLLTDGEESGLVGAKAFVSKHPLAKEIAAVVNLEARGTGGRSLMFETSEDNGWLISAYRAAVRDPDTSSLNFEIYRRMPNRTDFSIFKRAGMAGMNFAFIQNVAYYHTAADNLEHLDPGSLQHQGDNALAVVRALAAMDLSDRPPGNVVYTDLLGLTVVQWPESWSVPLAVLASLLAAIAVLRLLHTRTVRMRSLLVGLVAFPALVIVPVLVGIGLRWCFSGLFGTLRPGSPCPALARGVLWSEVAVAVVALTFIFSRWFRCWELWSSVWIWWSLGALVVSATIPGASFLLLIPIVAASLAGARVQFSGLRERPWANRAAIMCGGLFVAIFWWKLVLVMEDTTAFLFTPGITAPLAVLIAAMAPAWMPETTMETPCEHNSNCDQVAAAESRD